MPDPSPAFYSYLFIKTAHENKSSNVNIITCSIFASKPALEKNPYL